MPTIVTRLGKGSPLTTAELDANLTNINAETVDNSGVFNLRPSLDIDLVGSKSVSPLVSFSRGSTGTYFDSDGLLKTAGINQPRFNYDPVTGELKGLLVEESRTNLLTYSEQFDNAAWLRTGILNVVPDFVISPNGLLNADLIIESGNNEIHTLSRPISMSGTTCISTVYIKSYGRQYIQLLVGYGAFSTQYANFDILNEIVTTKTTNVTATIKHVGNNWYKCSMTRPIENTGITYFYVSIIPTGTAGLLQSYQGDGTSGIYIWGAQLEAGLTPTSYIPTTSTTVTRSADQLSINKTSNWFNSTNGTLSLSHDAASGQPLLGDGSSTVISSLGAGTVNIDYSNTQLSVVTQSGQSNNTTGIFNFDTDLYIGGNSTSKINNHIKYLKFYPNNVVNSTPDGSGLLLDTGFALLQEDGSVIFQE